VQTSTPSNLTVQTYSSWDDLAPFSSAWDGLVRQSAKPTIFSTPEWLGAWWKAYGREKQLVTLALLDVGGELAGLAPFYLEKTRGGIRQLRLVGDGSGDSDNLDLICRAGWEHACSQSLLNWLASASMWDVGAFNTLPTDSQNLHSLLSGLQQRRWAHSVYARPNSAINLPTQWESYLGQLSKKQVVSLKSHSRRVQRHNQSRIVRCRTDDELARYVEVFFDLHQRGWTDRGQPGIFAVPERRAFYLDMSHALLRRGWLEFWLLEINEAIAAALFLLRYGDTVYGLQAGRDPAYRADGVGMVLQAYVLRQFIDEGVRCYDFLGGMSEYKRSWDAQPGHYTDLHFAKPLTVGAIDFQWERATRSGKEWLKQRLVMHAPGSVYSTMSNLYRRVRRS
jgi:CelD/BcsL family acetyltransferase involved in cellulose biosynthesis